MANESERASAGEYPDHPVLILGYGDLNMFSDESLRDTRDSRARSRFRSEEKFSPIYCDLQVLERSSPGPTLDTCPRSRDSHPRTT